jgi:hypothetical protein
VHVSIKKLTDARLLRQARCFKMGSLDAHRVQAVYGKAGPGD